MEKLKSEELIELLKTALVQSKIELDAHIYINPKDSEKQEYIDLKHDIELLKSLLPE